MSSRKQPWSGYGIIEGGVADDRVIDAVEAYINGYADVEISICNSNHMKGYNYVGFLIME